MTKIIAGIDVGNSTTEVAIAEISDFNRPPRFLGSSRVPTTGIKGTLSNIPGMALALRTAVEDAHIAITDLDLALLNEATPVIGDIAMETITETIITESTMIGHNPGSPGGMGIGVGQTIHIQNLVSVRRGEPVIVVIPKAYDFEVAASLIKRAIEAGIDVQGGIVQADDGVLIANRLPKILPFVDEVGLIDYVPLNMLAAVEVGDHGQVIRQLCNPYGIATLFELTPQETQMVIPIAKALIGLRSAVVIRTPAGDVQTRRIPAGTLKLIGDVRTAVVEMDGGADVIMEGLAQVGQLQDVEGAAGTNVGGMVERVRQTMSDVTEKPLKAIKIRDILAVDCLVPQKVSGGLAQEFSMENAVGLAAMVNTDQLLMERLAQALSQEIGVPVELGGVEANMAILGTHHARHRCAPGNSGPGRRFHRRRPDGEGAAGAEHSSGRGGQHGLAAHPTRTGFAQRHKRRCGRGNQTLPIGEGGKPVPHPQRRQFRALFPGAAGPQIVWPGSPGNEKRAGSHPHRTHHRAHPRGAPGSQAARLFAQQPARPEDSGPAGQHPQH